MTLTGKRVLLGITGGIAAYKAPELVRLLVKAGADVRVAMTEAATRFIGPTTMQALSGQPVWTDLWDARVNDSMGHIELSRDRDLILVAPASADFLAKLAHGLCDDLLSTLCVARRCPLMVAPAMNVEMWQNPATRRNAETLRADGVHIVGPAGGGRRSHPHQRTGIAADAGRSSKSRCAHRAGDVRGGEERRHRRRRVHLGGRGRRLSGEEPVREKDKEGNRHAAPRSRGEPGHPRRGGVAAQAAVLRRLRRRKREAGRERESEAGKEEVAADRGQHRPGHDGDRKSTRLNSSHVSESRMPSSA